MLYIARFGAPTPRRRVMVEFATIPARSFVAEGPDIVTARA